MTISTWEAAEQGGRAALRRDGMTTWEACGFPSHSVYAAESDKASEALLRAIEPWLLEHYRFAVLMLAKVLYVTVESTGGISKQDTAQTLQELFKGLDKDYVGQGLRRKHGGGR